MTVIRPPELLVVNKVDVAGDLMLAKLRHAARRGVSARTGDGIDGPTSWLCRDTAVDGDPLYDRGDGPCTPMGGYSRRSYQPEGTDWAPAPRVSLRRTTANFGARSSPWRYARSGLAAPVTCRPTARLVLCHQNFS